MSRSKQISRFPQGLINIKKTKGLKIKFRIFASKFAL